jgi:uncharacterized protein
MRVFRWAAFALTLIGAPLCAQDYPSYGDKYINDFAGLLSPEAEARLRPMMIALFEETDIEFTIVTVNRMRDHGHSGEIEPFATGLFNDWGVGDSEWDDGVMLLVARDDRQTRIELGAGYSRADDRVAQRIIDETILPEFRRDSYESGIERGAVRLMADLREIRPERKTGFFAWLETGFFAWLGRAVEHLGAWILAILAPIGAGAAWLARQAARYRPRVCPNDGTKMALLDEFADDQHLDQGQAAEERVGSVNHDVWRCDACGHTLLESYQGWFSRYGACRSCGYRTLRGSSWVVNQATTTSTGLRQTDYECHHCGNNYSTTEIIPERRESPSSSGGGSSFGGGSSSGGGASGRW